jgi:uncharacterized protein YbjQ (UPF0145 family)
MRICGGVIAAPTIGSKWRDSRWQADNAMTDDAMAISAQRIVDVRLT